MNQVPAVSPGLYTAAARRRGFALPVALLLLAAVAGLLLAFIRMESGLRVRTENAVLLREAVYAARSGVEHAAAWLSQADPQEVPGPYLLEGALSTGASYRVRIRDNAGLFPINRASRHELGGLIVGLGATHEQAAAFVEALHGYRSGAGGVSTETQLPRDLVHPAEIYAFAQGPLDLLRQLEDHLTVWGNGLINVNTAAAPVLLSIPGITVDAVRVIEAHRQRGQAIGSVAELQNALPADARRILQDSIGEFVRRVTFESSTYNVSAWGYPHKEPHLTAASMALVVRQGRNMVIISRNERV
jgi:type II secretory pathway component PulK